MYLKNPENWLTVSESTATIGDNYFGKTKYESSQFKEQPEAIKLLNEEVRMLQRKLKSLIKN